MLNKRWTIVSQYRESEIVIVGIVTVALVFGMIGFALSRLA